LDALKIFKSTLSPILIRGGLIIPTVFTETFEGNTLANFDVVLPNTSIVTSPRHLGSRAMKAILVSPDFRAWVAKTVNLQDITVDAWVRFPSLPNNNTYLELIRIAIDGSGTSDVSVGIWKDTTGTAWSFGTTDNYKSILVNTWYHLKIRRVIGNGNGVSTLWVNDVQIQTKTAEIQPIPAAYVYIGIVSVYNGGGGVAGKIVYVDDITITDNGVVIPVTYNLTISATTGGTTNPAAGIYPYASGTSVTPTATPSSGYKFDNWIVDGATASNSTVVMNTNHTVQAIFSLIQITPPTGNLADIPDDWQLTYGTGPQIIFLDSTVVRTAGKPSMRIERHVEGVDTNSAREANGIWYNIKPGDHIVAKCWMKTDPSGFGDTNPYSGARIGLDFYGPAGRILGIEGNAYPETDAAQRANYVPWGTSTWTQRTIEITVPATFSADGDLGYPAGSVVVPTSFVMWMQGWSSSYGSTDPAKIWFADAELYINPVITPPTGTNLAPMPSSWAVAEYPFVSIDNTVLGPSGAPSLRLNADTRPGGIRDTFSNWQNCGPGDRIVIKVWIKSTSSSMGYDGRIDKGGRIGIDFYDPVDGDVYGINRQYSVPLTSASHVPWGTSVWTQQTYDVTLPADTHINGLIPWIMVFDAADTGSVWFADAELYINPVTQQSTNYADINTIALGDTTGDWEVGYMDVPGVLPYAFIDNVVLFNGSRTLRLDQGGMDEGYGWGVDRSIWTKWVNLAPGDVVEVSAWIKTEAQSGSGGLGARIGIDLYGNGVIVDGYPGAHFTYEDVLGLYVPWGTAAWTYRVFTFTVPNTQFSINTATGATISPRQINGGLMWIQARVYDEPGRAWFADPHFYINPTVTPPSTVKDCWFISGTSLMNSDGTPTTEAQRIATAHDTYGNPTTIIISNGANQTGASGPFWNNMPESLITFFHNHGMKCMIWCHSHGIPNDTWFTVDQVKAQINYQMSVGPSIDMFNIDEMEQWGTDRDSIAYYTAIRDYVWSLGKKVAMNPGSKNILSTSPPLTDYISPESEWNALATENPTLIVNNPGKFFTIISDWYYQYWMTAGLSSRLYPGTYVPIDKAEAVQHTLAAWNAGINHFIYYPSDVNGSYVSLPSWWESYLSEIAGISPPPVTGTFGQTTKGAQTSGQYMNYMVGSRFAATATGNAQSITAFIQNTSGTAGTAKCAIYKESDKMLLAQTEEITIPAGFNNWQTFNFTTPPAVTNGSSYSLIIWFKDSNYNLAIFCDAAAAGKSWYANSAYAASFPAGPYNGFLEYADEAFVYSLYCKIGRASCRERV
jgi:hypothetical protein